MHDIFSSFKKCSENNTTIYSFGWINCNSHQRSSIHIYDILNHQPFQFIQNKQRKKTNDECISTLWKVGHIYTFHNQDFHPHDNSRQRWSKPILDGKSIFISLLTLVHL
jgi:hypothetical protein